MSRAGLSLLLFAIACGDDGGAPTGGRPDATPPDAPLDTCEYREMADATNDTTGTGTPETTGVTFGGRTVLCGVFEHTHFDGDITVDVDSYIIDVPTDSDVLIRLFGAGAEDLEYVGLDVYPMGSTTPVGTLTFYGNHGVVSTRLAAGSYEILPFVLGAEAALESVPYRVEIVTDVPDTRCPEVATGGYTEGTDTGATANEVVALPPGQPPALTAANDVPEATTFVIAPDLQIRLAGEAKDVGQPDLYEDKDTFLISTGAGTNELTVRLGWTTAGANLDWILFEENTTTPIVRANGTATTGLESLLTAVKPNTDYWLLIGARANATVPASYAASLCGAQFTPP